MPTYYEMLNLEPTATLEEIETALDTQYHRWRRLVTHHDPGIVNQANQALQTLETIRTTLTDIEKRAVYDSASGVTGSVAGLSDPDALLQATAPVPPAPPETSRNPKPDSQRLDAWTCPNCQTPNRIGAKHCSKCGELVGRACPNCNKMIAVAAQFCEYCGSDVQAILEKCRCEALEREQQLKILQQERRESQKKLKNLKEQWRHSSINRTLRLAFIAGLISVGLMTCLVSVVLMANVFVSLERVISEEVFLYFLWGTSILGLALTVIPMILSTTIYALPPQGESTSA